jgi:hypothetical protein
MDFSDARRRKSRRSSGQADRVEVAGHTAVHDAENPDGTVPFSGKVDWSAFAK